MAPSDAYVSTPSTGKLKLKGVSSDAKVKKHKKNKATKSKADAVEDSEKDTSVVLRHLKSEDEVIKNEIAETKQQIEAEEDGAREPDVPRVKTEAERRHEEQRRKRLDERLKREGIKSHKQRVEELNRYLSGLSEHHDMPRIGPG